MTVPPSREALVIARRRPAWDRLSASPRSKPNDAFISYAHEDRESVEWPSRLLQSYWVPWRRRRRIFIDDESLTAQGGLTPRIQTGLSNSRFLIVCCSNASANSTWVGIEIERFLQTHEPSSVLACLVGPEAEIGVPPALAALAQTQSVLLKPVLEAWSDALPPGDEGEPPARTEDEDADSSTL